MVTVARDDAGNKGLQLSTSTAFKALGGQAIDIVPYASNITNFSTVLADLKVKIATYTALYGASGTAVYYASFDECVDLFKQAAADPVLSSVRWYGGDGVALSTALTANAAASAFAAATHFFAPSFGLPLQPDPKWQTIAANIKTRTGIDPDAFALATYDAMWVIANTLVAVGSAGTDFSKLKSVFELKANSYYGITGALLLNQFGDRSIGSFDYWGIVPEGGTYKWKLVGRSE